MNDTKLGSNLEKKRNQNEEEKTKSLLENSLKKQGIMEKANKKKGDSKNTQRH